MREERDMPYTFKFRKCGTCSREFLVESVLIGTDHTMDTIVSCKECLKKKPLSKEFIEKHPEEAKIIQEWLTS